jgi:hypothetical protein
MAASADDPTTVCQHPSSTSKPSHYPQLLDNASTYCTARRMACTTSGSMALSGKGTRVGAAPPGPPSLAPRVYSKLDRADRWPVSDRERGVPGRRRARDNCQSGHTSDTLLDTSDLPNTWLCIVDCIAANAIRTRRHQQDFTSRLPHGAWPPHYWCTPITRHTAHGTAAHTPSADRG